MTAEKVMEARVASWLTKRSMIVARQIRLGDMRLDIVAYDKKKRLFKVVECKPAVHQTVVGQTFGQIAAYINRVTDRTDEFVDSFSDQVKMRFGRWMQATEYGRRIKAEFYVALPEAACKDIECLRNLKRQHADVGIIRHKPNGQCRPYLRERNKPNYELARATARICDLTQYWLSQR